MAAVVQPDGTLANTNVRTHLQALLFIGNINIGTGRLQSFDADQDFGTQAVHGVGDFLPAEFVHLKFTGTITMDAFMIRTDDLQIAGLAALGVGVLSLGVVDIEVYDTDKHGGSGDLLRRYEHCKISRFRESIREGQICGENATVLFRNVVKDDSQVPAGDRSPNLPDTQ